MIAVTISDGRSMLKDNPTEPDPAQLSRAALSVAPYRRTRLGSDQ